MEEKKEKPITPTIYQCKWYDTTAKSYEDCFVRSMQKAMEKATEAFNQGSKYFSINLIDIE